MPATVDELKQQARRDLPSEIAAFVVQEIDREADLHPRPPGGLEGVSTAFLGDLYYRDLAHGAFTGRPTVQWNGMDEFMFIDTTHAPFFYTTSQGRTIRPRSMPTDGGSIPRILHALKSYSPWGYAPGYIIHDWLFEAHRKKIAPDDDWQFEAGAVVLAECIKSLMENGYTAADGTTAKLRKNVDSLYIIYNAVRSPFARRFWDKT